MKINISTKISSWRHRAAIKRSAARRRGVMRSENIGKRHRVAARSKHHQQWRIIVAQQTLAWRARDIAVA